MKRALVLTLVCSALGGCYTLRGSGEDDHDHITLRAGEAEIKEYVPHQWTAAEEALLNRAIAAARDMTRDTTFRAVVTEM